jgi:hypothetical protein
LSAILTHRFLSMSATQLVRAILDVFAREDHSVRCRVQTLLLSVGMLASQASDPSAKRLMDLAI